MLFTYITRLASKEIFSPSNKIHREVGRAKDLSAPPRINLLNKNLIRVVQYITTRILPKFKRLLHISHTAA